MDGNRFTDRLQAGWAAARFVCVGLDPDPAQVHAARGQAPSAESIVAFTRAIVDATCDLVLAYKPNSAFFELGARAAQRPALIGGLLEQLEQSGLGGRINSARDLAT